MLIIAVGITLFGCPSTENKQTVETNVREKIFLYSQGTVEEITQANKVQLIVKEITKLLAQADDIYLKSVSTSDINSFHEDKCVEVLFAQPIKITIEAIKQERSISKILIPLGEAMCTRHAHIIYGDPDYKPFNMLLNSAGCKKLQEIISNKSLSDQ